MALLKNIILVTHFLGLAALIGGWIATRMGSATLPLVVWGARIQLLTGLLLVGIIEMADEGVFSDLNHMKIGVKLLVTIAAVGAAEMAGAKARKNEPSSTLVDAAGALGVLNVLVATLWKVYS